MYFYCTTHSVGFFYTNREFIFSINTGVIGGVLYSLRAVYVNFSVKDRWNPKWIVWYLLRPFTSGISGFASFVFLKTGLIVFGGENSINNTTYAYYALAFIAGYNVDKFVDKIEEIAQTVWGIKRSRASENNETAEEEKK